MNVTVYQQPDCAVSPKLLDRIRAHGHEPVVIDMLAEPPNRAQLLALLVGMQKEPRNILRGEAQAYTDLGLGNDALSDQELLGALSEHPALIQGPIVVSDKGIRLCLAEEDLGGIL